MTTGLIGIFLIHSLHSTLFENCVPVQITIQPLKKTKWAQWQCSNVFLVSLAYKHSVYEQRKVAYLFPGKNSKPTRTLLNNMSHIYSLHLPPNDNYLIVTVLKKVLIFFLFQDILRRLVQLQTFCLLTSLSENQFMKFCG